MTRMTTNRHRDRRKRAFAGSGSAAILSIFLFALFCPYSAAEENTITIISPRGITPYRKAITGFKETMDGAGYNARYVEVDIKDKGAPGIVRNEKSDLFLAVGTEAALFGKRSVGKEPILFAMVLNPVENGIAASMKRAGTNITGVCLNISVETQFKALKDTAPGIKRVGILYSAGKEDTVREEIFPAARRAGFVPVARSVNSEKNISSRLDEIMSEADCLWAAVDTMIYNPRTAQNIILTTLKRGKPFMAFSSAFVKAGALLSLECDYRDIGSQAAEIAIKVLDGKTPGSLPVERPRKTRLVINLRTAEIIGVDVPGKVLDRAYRVFGEN